MWYVTMFIELIRAIMLNKKSEGEEQRPQDITYL